MTKNISDLRAKYNTNGNAIIPNTFQHPNIFVDRLMYYLSPVENVVLTFAVRRILGFQQNIMSRKDNISLSQFTDGITSEDGRALSMGCGIGLDAASNALSELEKYKILIPTTDKPDPRKGQEYWLQDDENKIDWLGLELRKDEKRTKYRKQTQKARYSVEQKGTVEQKARGDVEQKARVLLNRDTKPTETHRNPKQQEEAVNVFKIYESEIGLITPFISDALQDWEKDVPAKWIADAIHEAVANNIRNWKYIVAILNRWKEQGSQEAKEKRNAKSKKSEPKAFDGIRQWLEEQELNNGIAS